MAATSAGVFFNFNRGSEWWGLCPEADALPAPLSGAPPRMATGAELSYPDRSLRLCRVVSCMPGQENQP